MPYYAAGDYYGRGDYYRGDYYRGDPGLLSGLGGFLKKAAGTALGFLPGGNLLTAGAKLIGPSIASKVLGPTAGTALARAQAKLPTVPTFAEFAIPAQGRIAPPPIQFLGGSPPQGTFQGTTFGGLPIGGRGFGGGRRRMNALNKKALTRAERRINSFVKIARKCLRHTGYAVVSRAARGGKGGFPARRRK
jgi:hypothetical protein